MFKIIDMQTKKEMGSYDNKQRARNRAEKLNLQYGAHRYIVQAA